MFLKRIAGLIALALGVLGVAACLAGAYGVWLVNQRLYQVNEQAFSVVDRELAKTEDRVRAVQKRVEASRITTNEIHEKIRNWGAAQAKDRLAERLDFEEHAQKLILDLKTADSFLEASAESLRGIQHLAALSQSLGASIDPASLDDVLEKIATARTKVEHVEQSVQGFRDLVVGKDNEPTRLAKVAKVALRTLATVSDLDTRLEAAANRVGELRGEARELRERTDHWITWTAVALWVILAWIGAGQLALCRCGWKMAARPRKELS